MGRMARGARVGLEPMTTVDPYFESFTEGSVVTTMRRTVTETDLVSFVQVAGLFEEIWLDAAKSASLGLGAGRAVPGGLTFAIAEWLLVLTGAMRHAVGMLGVDELRWELPVCCGDTVRCEVHIQSVRLTSNPARGLVVMAHQLLNQHDRVVLSYTSTRLIASRPEGDSE